MIETPPDIAAWVADRKSHRSTWFDLQLGSKMFFCHVMYELTEDRTHYVAAGVDPDDAGPDVISAVARALRAALNRYEDSK